MKSLKSSQYKKACEFSLAIAKKGLLAEPVVVPPAILLEHLDTNDTSRKAIAAAKEALETDGAFRNLVISEADDENLDDKNYAWLLSLRETGLAEDEPPPQPPVSFGLSSVGNQTDQEVENESSDSSSIESELSDLKNLVDRLTDEGDRLDDEGEMTPMVTTNIEDEMSALTKGEAHTKTLEAEVEVSRDRMDTLQAEMEASRKERDEAKKQKSDALRRQVQLERELAQSRDNRSELEGKVSELEVTFREVSEKFTKSEAAATELVAGNQDIAQQLEKLTAERNETLEEHAAMRIERDEATTKLAEYDRKSGGVDIETLKNDNRELVERSLETDAQIADLTKQIDTLSEDLALQTRLVQTLTEQESELHSKVKDLEAVNATMLSENTTFKTESERSSSSVLSLTAERDSLTTQVDELQQSLTGALGDLAKVREESDADRSAFRQMRSERDSLLARMSEIEQTQEDYAQKLNLVSGERDDLLKKQETLLTEKGTLKGEAAAAQTESDRLNDKVQLLQDKLEPLEAEIIAERKRGEGLARQLIDSDGKSDKEIMASLASTNDQKLQKDYDKMKKRLAEVEKKYKKEAKEYEKKLSTLEKNLSEAEKEPFLSEAASPGIDQIPTEAPPANNLVDVSFDKNLDSVAPSSVAPANVWDQDWPPKDGSVSLPESFLDEGPAEDLSIGGPKDELDELSEIVSKTRTDLDAVKVDAEDDINLPPSVFDAKSGQWHYPENSEEVPAVPSSLAGDASLSTSARVPVVIPTDVAADEMSMVEYLLSVDEAVLLVEGDSVATLGWSKLSVLEKRTSLVSFLADIADKYGSFSQVVFDGAIAGQDALPASRQVRIRLSNPPAAPVASIDDILTSFPDSWPVIVVTDDSSLARSAKDKGATVLSNEQLLDFIDLLARS